MHYIDWIVLFLILTLIAGYGIWKTIGVKTTEDYLKGGNYMPWWSIGLSVMATQASAITFLSTPGQAYDDGMRFAQFYFGLPIALIIICIYILPKFYTLNVFTAYQYLEERFDIKTRTLTAILFLIQRGLAAGLTIFAPSIILSSIMGWNLTLTSFIIGFFVIIYTIIGGTKAVSQTQKQQMIVILLGMAVAFFIAIGLLPKNVTFKDAVDIAGYMGKMNIVDYKFDLSNRYNIWSALLGGTFLFLSYFGTDQSQVQRYLSGKSLSQSRLGLMFNSVFKVPMQFMILLTGIMVFVFYQFNDAPLHFNKANTIDIEKSPYALEYSHLNKELKKVESEKQLSIEQVIREKHKGHVSKESINRMNALMDKEKEIRLEAKDLFNTYNKSHGASLEIKDADYVFIRFITENLPIGLIGLLIAVIFSAAMSSTSSELNALATISVIDLYKRSFVRNQTNKHYLVMAKWFTLMWGLIALGFASVVSLFENLIEAVNVVSSLFYGSVLGVFLIAFFIKYIKSKAVFLAAIIGEMVVLIIFALEKLNHFNIAYLWLNLIGCATVVFTSILIQAISNYSSNDLKV